MASLRQWLVAVVVPVAFAACVTTQRLPLENPYGTLEGAKEGEIFHVPTGIKVTKAQLLDIISGSRIIYVGETHDNVYAHYVQLEIIRGLAERFPGQVAVGMEVFQRPYQEVMDRWSRGELSERDFLKQSQWYSSWGMDYGYYRAILEYIQERHIPLLALNAPAELIEEVREHGLDGLSKPWRIQLPHMDLSDPHHRRLVEAFYKAHPPTSAKSFETFYQVFVLWDETMAETVANYL
ncbi:MAG: ChaN family lipoprotein, partial [Syntrophobacterales bacterium]